MLQNDIIMIYENYIFVIFHDFPSQIENNSVRPSLKGSLWAETLMKSSSIGKLMDFFERQEVEYLTDFNVRRLYHYLLSKSFPTRRPTWVASQTWVRYSTRQGKNSCHGLVMVLSWYTARKSMRDRQLWWFTIVYAPVVRSDRNRRFRGASCIHQVAAQRDNVTALYCQKYSE